MGSWERLNYQGNGTMSSELASRLMFVFSKRVNLRIQFLKVIKDLIPEVVYHPRKLCTEILDNETISLFLTKYQFK